MAYFLKLWFLSLLLSTGATVAGAGIVTLRLTQASGSPTPDLPILVSGLFIAVFFVSLLYTFAVQRYLLPRRIKWSSAEIGKYALLYLGVGVGGLLLQLLARTIFSGGSFMALVVGFVGFVALWMGAGELANLLFPTSERKTQSR